MEREKVLPKFKKLLNNQETDNSFELAELVSQTALIDIDLAKRMVIYTVNFLEDSEYWFDLTLDCIVSKCNRKQKELGYKILLDNEIKEAILKRRRSLIRFGNCRFSYINYFGVESKSEVWLEIFNYGIKYKLYNEIEFILKTLEVNNIKYFLFNYYFMYTSFNSYRKERAILDENSYNLILAYINQINDSSYRDYLLMIINYDKGKKVDFNDLMKVLDQISVNDEYILFEECISHILSNYPEKQYEICKYLLSKYYPLIKNEGTLSAKLGCIISKVISRDVIAFITKHEDIFEKLISELDLYGLNEYGCHTYIVDKIVRLDNYYLLNKTCKWLSENRKNDSLVMTLNRILSSKPKPKLSSEMAKTIKEWAETCDNVNLTDMISLYNDDYKFSDIVKYIDKCQFTYDSFEEEQRYILGATDTMMLSEIKDVIYILDKLLDKIIPLEKESLSYKVDDYYDFRGSTEKKSNQILWVVPKLNGIILNIFGKMLSTYDPSQVCYYIRNQERIYKYISDYTSYNKDRVHVWHIEQVFEAKLSTFDFINDEFAYEYYFYLYPNGVKETYEEIIRSLGNGESLSYNIAKIQTLILANLQSDILSDDEINNRIFNNINLYMNGYIKDNNSEVPLGISYFLYYSLRRISNSNILLVYKLVISFETRLMQYPHFIAGLPNYLGYDNFIELILMDEKLLSIEASFYKDYFRLLRYLLDNSYFDKFISLFEYVIEYYKENQENMFKGFNSMLLLKKGVEQLDVNKLNFLGNCLEPVTESPAKVKLNNKLERLKIKCEG